jgi:hypothetical protein
LFFRPGHQTHEPARIIRRVAELADECQILAFASDGDVCQAYDLTKPSVAISTWQRLRARDIIIGARMGEIRGGEAVAKLEPNIETCPIPRARSVIRGHPSSPEQFNTAIDIPAIVFSRWCRKRNYGIDIRQHQNSCLILLAGNYWLLATSVVMLSCAIARSNGLLRSHWRRAPQTLGARLGAMLVSGKSITTTSRTRGQAER